jgi:hypothetical protein
MNEQIHELIDWLENRIEVLRFEGEFEAMVEATIILNHIKEGETK